jgi:hypothetical protein
VKAIHTGLAVLLAVCNFLWSLAHLRDIQAYQAVKDSIDSYDALVDLLETIETFLDRLDNYTRIPLTAPMTEMIVKVFVELLSTLALATEQIKEGKSSPSSVMNYISQLTNNATQKSLLRISLVERRTSRRYSKG